MSSTVPSSKHKEKAT